MKAWWARTVYSAALRLSTPLYLARLLWRSVKEPLYRHALGERLGYGAAVPAGCLWVHAVSLGETRAAAALLDALHAQAPDLRVLLTHGTATGRAAGAALLRAGDAQAWLPYDTPGAVRRFIARHRPAALVLLETEVWPNLLHAAAAANLPTVLANARLSERSLAKAERYAGLMRPAAAAIGHVLAQSADDARRFLKAGARRVDVYGNVKFDVEPNAAQLAAGRAWRQAAGRPVVMAASTREGEEEPLLGAWLAQHDAAPGRPVLLIVPRHPQRFDEVAALVAQRRLRLARRSAWGPPLHGRGADAAALRPPADAAVADVWLGDSVGEMALYYAMADVALLGGSFARLGGQNLIEAAACGCPLVMGPHTFNFAQAAELALAAGAAVRVPDVDRGMREALMLIGARGREGMARRAREFAEAHRGAARRMAGAILAAIGAASQAQRHGEPLR